MITMLSTHEFKVPTIHIASPFNHNMAYSYFFLPLFLVFHFVSFSSSSSLHSGHLCHPYQSSSLLQFKNSLSVNTSLDDPAIHVCPHIHPKTTSWDNGTDCCSWLGVTCHPVSGHVTGLDLSCSGLQGELGPNSTLFHLNHLQRLNLAHNHLSASHHLPSQFGAFVSLTHLNLSYCHFQGNIPSQISHLSKLISLDLSENSGLALREITWKRLLQNATALRDIVLDGTDMSSMSSPSPLSFLTNMSSSSLVALSLVDTGLKGNLTGDILCLPNLEALSLSYNYGVELHLPVLNCTHSLTKLDLSGCGLKGPISPFFSNLTHLTSLSLSSNNLNGSIPSSLLQLQNLTYLDLSDNDLSGSIPSSLSNLQNLVYLGLSVTKLSGPIPNVFGSLTKLQTLSLEGNNFTGQLPSSLFSLPQLSSLECSYNRFEGAIPGKITGLSNLKVLGLSNNLLNGTIPSWCLSLPSLIHINLCGNMLKGTIPNSISSLVNLGYLCLSSNNTCSIHFSQFAKLQNLEFLSLSGYNPLSLHSEPNFTYNFPNLRTLQLFCNNLTDFSELSANFSSLRSLDLSNNEMQGKVPKWIHDIDSLGYLNLSQNKLTSIEKFSWYGLEYLDLSSNLITGHIPWSICNASYLTLLNLSQNKFTGTIPQCLTNLSNLAVLDLHINKLSGTLPNTYSMGKSFESLNLSDNELEGPLPESLSNCTGLLVLNLGNNDIEDTFPHWIPRLEYLRVLVLRANKFHGSIPTSSMMNNSFLNLIIFDISCNNLSGPFPKAFIRNFEAMKDDVVQVYNKNGDYMPYMELDFAYLGYEIQPFYDGYVATTKGVTTNFARIQAGLINIDLSENKFEGEIPNIIGELRGLKGLNLSHNSFIGPIPQSVGNLTNLESLDLSSNMLSGAIPAELANLNFLEALNLSNNHLVGAIPRGKQLDTFSSESYEGNMGLCGVPMPIQCNHGQEQKPPSSPISDKEERFGFGWEAVAIGYGCGMVFGVCMGWCVLCTGKPQWLVRLVEAVPKKRGMRTWGNRLN